MLGSNLVSNFIENNMLDDDVSKEEVVLMAQALHDAIPRDKLQIQAFKVLSYLASRTIALVREGKDARVSTKEIHVDLDGNESQQPSAWMSRIWGQIESSTYGQLEPAVRERCRALGLTCYPRPVKHEGSPAYYSLEKVALAASGAPDPECEWGGKSASPGAVVYQQDLTLQLSLLGRLVIGRGIAWTRPKKVLLAFGIFALTIACLVLLNAGYVLSFRSHTPLSASELLTIIFAFGGPCFIFWWLDKAMRLFDDRIVIAPDWALAWEEFGATLELEGELESGGTKAIKVVRYTSTCPICDGMLKLDRGEPDFPRRVVGRCSKSPREHVFSFDRVTLRGKSLVSPL